MAGISTKPAMFLWEYPNPELFEVLWGGGEVDCPPGFTFWVNPRDWACDHGGRKVEPQTGNWAKLVEKLPNGMMTGRTISAQLMEDPDGRRYWRPVTFGNERDRAGTE